eukprot:Nitzschia sp. Nitz4//scaffold289_size23394//15018//16307//NITZ4_008479-RA/size23394-augustus-gene-0.1-mRNA-1//1//CDS//3329545828//2681//frame0
MSSDDTSSSLGSANENELQDKIGLGITGTLWILASWRLIFQTLIPRAETSTGRFPISTSVSEVSWVDRFSQWFTRRRIFHGLLWMALSCQGAAYTGMLGYWPCRILRPAMADKVAYLLLEVCGRTVLESLAYSVVTALWLQTAIDSHPAALWGMMRLPFGHLPAVFVLTMMAAVLASAAVAVASLLLFPQLSRSDLPNLSLTRIQLFLEASAWAAHSLVVLPCLVTTTRRVLALPQSLNWKKKYSLLAKAVLPMVIAAILHMLRSLCLFAVIFHLVQRQTWLWYILFLWIPTALTVPVLLYSVRKRDVLPPPDLQQPLLPPPAEAFLAFSQHRQGLDDSFSFCRSPITHVVLPPPEEADNDDVESHDHDTLSVES